MRAHITCLRLHTLIIGVQQPQTFVQSSQGVCGVPHQLIPAAHETSIELSGWHPLREAVVACERGRNRGAKIDCSRDDQVWTRHPNKEGRHTRCPTKSICLNISS